MIDFQGVNRPYACVEARKRRFNGACTRVLPRLLRTCMPALSLRRQGKACSKNREPALRLSCTFLK